MDLDLTAPARDLAVAATDLTRLLPGRLTDPVLAGTVVTASAHGVTFAGTDRERGIQLTRPARTHREGRALVPARLLADTLRALDAGEVRLVVEGTKLAVRTPGARFALPLLDTTAHPGVLPAPARVGTVEPDLFVRAAGVAPAASKDDALPVFTGVHVRQEGDRLVLVASDRFRMAVARLPWRPEADGLDVLVPADLLTEVAKQVRGVEREIVLHADADRIGMSFPGSEVTTAVLDATYPDESRHLDAPTDGVVDVDADELAGAVRRVAHYTEPQGAVHLDCGESEVRVRAGDPRRGDAEEAVKATLSGDRLAPAYQPRYLADALHAFAGRTVRLALRSAARSSVLSEVEPGAVDLRHVVMPKRT